MATGLQMANPVGAVVLTLAGGGTAWWALRTLLPAGIEVARTGLAALVACRFLATAAFMGADSFIPLAADRIHEVSPLWQGMVIIGAALAWTGGQWIRAHNPPDDAARAVRNGFIVLAAGVLLVTPVLWDGWPLWAVFLGWSVGGLGMGLLFNPTTVSAMTYAKDGVEGKVSSQITLADALGYSLMGGIGGATVAAADRTSMSISTALGINFAIAFGVAMVGVAVSHRIRSAP